MKKATYYHAGCPVCQSAENGLIGVLDPDKVHVEIVHLGQMPHRIEEAERMGVKTLPALVIDEEVFHINYGASLADLKQPPEPAVVGEDEDEYPGTS